jgi:hypothetical protein
MPIMSAICQDAMSMVLGRCQKPSADIHSDRWARLARAIFSPAQMTVNDEFMAHDYVFRAERNSHDSSQNTLAGEIIRGTFALAGAGRRALPLLET